MIYHVFANRSNIGDWLSAKGIQKLLSPYEVTECLCDKPFVNRTIKMLKCATGNDLIVIGGGGLLMDYFVPFWEKFRPITDIVPFVAWGIGFCDIKHENTLPPQGLIEDIILKSKLFIVRDELTWSTFPSCKLPPPVPCPSVNMIDRVAENGNDFLHVVNCTNIGPDIYNAMYMASRDFARQSGRVYREVNNHITQGSEQELARILSIYRNSGIVISSALHGCIIAVAMGLKILAVSGDRKIEGFMKQVGLEDWVLDRHETKYIVEYLSQLEFQPSVEDKLREIRNKNEHVGQYLKQIVFKGLNTK
jgi:polysaccharide pyruvyl transferase WcaK-like protein